MKVQIEEGDRRILEYKTGSSQQHVLSVVHDQVYGTYNMIWSSPDGDEIQWRGSLSDTLRKFEREVIEFEEDKERILPGDPEQSTQPKGQKQRLVRAGLEAYEGVLEECAADPQYEGDKGELFSDLEVVREMLATP